MITIHTPIQVRWIDHESFNWVFFTICFCMTDAHSSGWTKINLNDDFWWRAQQECLTRIYQVIHHHGNQKNTWHPTWISTWHSSLDRKHEYSGKHEGEVWQLVNDSLSLWAHCLGLFFLVGRQYVSVFPERSNDYWRQGYTNI